MTDTAENTGPSAEPGGDTPQPAVHAEGPTTAPLTEEDRINAELDAHDAIKTHVIAAMTVGLVPLPGVDLAGTVAVQVRMVSKICEIYGVTIRENAAKTAVLSLAGGVLPIVLAGTFVSGLKVIPGLGSLAGAAGSSILGGAVTYAIGSVFQQHLATHDSLIDFDTDKMKSVMGREFAAGLNVARSLRNRMTDVIVPKVKATAAPEAEATEAGTAAPDASGHTPSRDTVAA